MRKYAASFRHHFGGRIKTQYVVGNGRKFPPQICAVQARTESLRLKLPVRLHPVDHVLESNLDSCHVLRFAQIPCLVQLDDRP